MRYTVLTSRTFHNRITRYLGVLVGAALVAMLGLPTAAQAQTPSRPSVMGFDDGMDFFTVLAPDHAPIGATDGNALLFWVLEINAPGAGANAKMVSGGEGNATTAGMMEDSFMVQAKGVDGNWEFRIGSGTGVDGDEDGTVEVSEVTDLVNSPWLIYRHGKPDRPANFTYASREGAGVHIFTWTDAGDKAGLAGYGPYALRWTDGDPALLATQWKDAAGPLEGGSYQLTTREADALKPGTTYTFELTVTGETSSTTKQLTSAPAVVMVTAEGVTVPTLPEIAFLFLAMLLLGSGAYMLMRRQADDLTLA